MKIEIRDHLILELKAAEKQEANAAGAQSHARAQARLELAIDALVREIINVIRNIDHPLS